MQVLLQLRHNFGHKIAKNTVSYIIIIRVIILWLLLSLKIAIIAIDNQLEDHVSIPADYIYYITHISILLLNIGLQIIFYRARIFSSALQFFYWLLHTICYIPTFKQDIENFLSNTDVLVSGLSSAYFLLREGPLSIQIFSQHQRSPRIYK